jgi:hypothetical protein
VALCQARISTKPLWGFPQVILIIPSHVPNKNCILGLFYDPDETRTVLFVSIRTVLHFMTYGSILFSTRNKVVNLYKRYLNLKNDRLITSVVWDGGGRIMRVAYGCKHLHAIFLKRIISGKSA